MKIIYLSSARLPTEKAHGLQIVKMCEAMSRLGNDVELLIPRRSNPISDDIFSFYGVEKNFSIKFLRCPNLVFYCPAPVVYILQSIIFLIISYFYILKKKYDFIYTREPLAGLFFDDYVAEIHSLPKTKNFLFVRSLKRAQLLVVITSGLKLELLNYGCLFNKIVVSPDAVDLEDFRCGLSKDEARKKIGLPLDRKIILYSGHLYAWKGVDILAQAAQYLSDDYLIVFVGGTTNDVETFRKKYAVINNLSIVGYKLHKEIPIFLQASDILILPNSGKETISRLYTSPMKLFEYMASNRPIIASDLPSLREILNGSNAYLVEPDNPAKLAEAIKYVSGKEDLMTSLALAAFNDVKNYTWNERAKKILTFIK